MSSYCAYNRGPQTHQRAPLARWQEWVWAPRKTYSMRRSLERKRKLCARSDRGHLLGRRKQA